MGRVPPCFMDATGRVPPVNLTACHRVLGNRLATTPALPPYRNPAEHRTRKPMLKLRFDGA